MLLVSNVTDDGLRAYTYDLANQPTQITGLANAQFVYDGNFKRVKQTVNGNTTYSFYSQSGQLLHRDDATRNRRTDYVSAGGMRVAKITEGVPTYLYSDHLGSPIKAADANGYILPGSSENYLPYGEKINSAQNHHNDVSFTGHIEDTALGLTYMQARFYDPAIGRFLSNDPVGFTEHVARGGSIHGFNRYAYAANNPYKYVDPDGEAWGLASKVIKVALKGGDIASVAAGAISDAKVLTSRNASLSARILAAGSLASEIFSPVSARDAKAAAGAIGDVTKRTGPEVGGGADLKNLSPGEQKRIQNAANRSGADVTVVGSQTTGTKPSSDFDFVIEGGTSRSRSKIKNSLPQGPRGTGDGSGRDFHDGPVQKDEPHIRFKPET